VQWNLALISRSIALGHAKRSGMIRGLIKKGVCTVLEQGKQAMMNSEDGQLWMRFHAADTSLNDARMALLQGAVDIAAIIATALSRASERGSALRLLLTLPEVQSRKHLHELVGLASVGHSDIGLTRSVLGRIDRAWLSEQITSHVDAILNNGTDEEYRRIAELYQELDLDLLKAHLALCAKHRNPAVQEVAADFNGKLL
jgi:hypothetical protein